MVNEVNNELVDRIPGNMHTFHSIDTVGDLDTTTVFLTEYLNSLSLSRLPKQKLKLKENALTILLRNIDNAGRCNGTWYLIK